MQYNHIVSKMLKFKFFKLRHYIYAIFMLGSR